MSFFTHHSRHSWPQYKSVGKGARSRNERKSEDFSIDENPFAFFISPPAEDDALALSDGDFSAGIDTTPAGRPRSPFHHNRPREFPLVTAGGKSPAAILRRWIKHMETNHPYINRRNQAEEAPVKPVTPFIAPASSKSDRGREAERSAEVLRGRRQVRSHSGRPRSWREPSADLWPVKEGCEGTNERGIDHIVTEKKENNTPVREKRIRFAEDVVVI